MGPYVPMASTANSRNPNPEPLPGPSTSTAAWILAILPLLQVAVVIGVAFAQYDATTTVIVAVACVSAPLCVLLAAADERQLLNRNYVSTGSPYWALVPAAYLVLRGYRCVLQSQDGLGPAWIHLGVVSGLTATFTIFWPWIKAFAYLTYAP